MIRFAIGALSITVGPESRVGLTRGIQRSALPGHHGESSRTRGRPSPPRQWVNPGNIVFDNAHRGRPSRRRPTTPRTSSQILVASNFGFSIPAGSTVQRDHGRGRPSVDHRLQRQGLPRIAGDGHDLRLPGRFEQGGPGHHLAHADRGRHLRGIGGHLECWPDGCPGQRSRLRGVAVLPGQHRQRGRRGRLHPGHAGLPARSTDAAGSISGCAVITQAAGCPRSRPSRRSSRRRSRCEAQEGVADSCRSRDRSVSGSAVVLRLGARSVKAAGGVDLRGSHPIAADTSIVSGVTRAQEDRDVDAPPRRIMIGRGDVGPAGSSIEHRAGSARAWSLGRSPPVRGAGVDTSRANASVQGMTKRVAGIESAVHQGPVVPWERVGHRWRVAAAGWSPGSGRDSQKAPTASIVGSSGPSTTPSPPMSATSGSPGSIGFGPLSRGGKDPSGSPDPVTGTPSVSSRASASVSPGPPSSSPGAGSAGCLWAAEAIVKALAGA